MNIILSQSQKVKFVNFNTGKIDIFVNKSSFGPNGVDLLVDCWGQKSCIEVCNNTNILKRKITIYSNTYEQDQINKKKEDKERYDYLYSFLKFEDVSDLLLDKYFNSFDGLYESFDNLYYEAFNFGYKIPPYHTFDDIYAERITKNIDSVFPGGCELKLGNNTHNLEFLFTKFERRLDASMNLDNTIVVNTPAAPVDTLLDVFNVSTDNVDLLLKRREVLRSKIDPLCVKINKRLGKTYFKVANVEKYRMIEPMVNELRTIDNLLNMSNAFL